jgi:aspartyl-tRNA(Asn)/glutamyl-tRNA(Gln) amidotransferase subunit C
LLSRFISESYQCCVEGARNSNKIKIKKMTINNETLKNLSKLSKIKIDDNLRDKLKEDLNLTMNMIDKINKIDCDQIEELSHPIKDNFNLREDIVSHDINRESLQKNSDKTEDGFYLVPKVIE